jgi:hypothetical protein
MKNHAAISMQAAPPNARVRARRIDHNPSARWASRVECGSRAGVDCSFTRRMLENGGYCSRWFASGCHEAANKLAPHPHGAACRAHASACLVIPSVRRAILWGAGPARLVLGDGGRDDQASSPTPDCLHVAPLPIPESVVPRRGAKEP